MSETPIKVGTRLDSVYGREHRGTVIEVGTFNDGKPIYSIRRDSDGFVWFGWPGTVERVPEAAMFERPPGNVYILPDGVDL